MPDGEASGYQAAVPALLFVLTLAIGSALLFAVQPMVARMALPILGGTPAVWNACMVFFQAAVLGGYALAHGAATRLGPRAQIAAFAALIVAGGLALPVRFGDGDGAAEAPLAWLLGRLGAVIGLSALALGAASPLLQRWYARARGGHRDPYFLYGASNVGSLAALLGYPLLLEPALPLDQQAAWWTVGYWIWGGLVAGCAWMGRGPAAVRAESPGSEGSRPESEPRVDVDWKRVLAWVGLGAVPASLLQGCTLFLTTDVASLPLLWVLPLALYLCTFVVAFEPWGDRWVAGARRALPYLAAALVYAILMRATHPVVVLIGLHLAFLFGAGLVCHGRLVALRPVPAALTRFYLALSVGGLLGGGFNAFVAPRLFSQIAEYPIAIALACAALPRRAAARTRAEGWPGDLAVAVGVGAGMLLLGMVLPRFLAEEPRLRDALVFGGAAVACCTLLDRPRRLALALGAAFLVGLGLQSRWAGNRYAERNFFGITRVVQDAEGRFNELVHGNTIHGRQWRTAEGRGEPLAYYHREGPVGRVFEEFRETRRTATGAGRPPLNWMGLPEGPRIGVIGLGIGSLSAYAEDTDSWTYFEIDPAVIRVAMDTNWFGFLSESRAGALRIATGDARLMLGKEADGSFDLLILDAFSSDSIPVHLLTREAVELYLKKLRPHGWLVAHISNRYLELEPVFAALARNAGIVCRSGEDDATHAPGKEPSHWMLLARRPRDLGRLTQQALWAEAEGADRVSLWTDQQAALLPLIQWR